MKTLYNVKLFREKGFIRKKCPICGDYFWTLNPDQNTCGEPPCAEYEFIGSPPTAKYRDLETIRKKYIEFFAKRGHTPVKRYPIVARWREDVYLVGASIYCFQPWVTEGVVDPPANPLVISQPCIRLTDLDNIGRTGRHLSCFEMMAHHAFNFKEITTYWNNKTVELCFNFFTEELKVPEEKVIFKEGMWSGGGNAGEDFEVLIDGLEVATLVFMHYRVHDSKLVEMGNYIVDTGYGLERILWLSTGSPTLYDSLFSEILPAVKKIVSVPEPDFEIMSTLSRYFGKIDVSKADIEKSYREIASLVGISVDELRSIVIPLENIYAVLDHCRALMFMIGDGVVPSNTGAGYLARLLIRRAIRNLLKLSTDVKLTDIMEISLKYWTSLFTEYRELIDNILEIVELEEKKYAQTLRRGRQICRTFIKKKREKEEKVSAEDLIYLYESHGIPPDIVREAGNELGVEITIPQNFYELLAKRAKPQLAKKEEAPLDPALVENIEKTRLLYYEDPYLFDFTAKVLKVISGKYVILDKTAFYPTGGGQPSDTGVLKTQSGEELEVVNVFKVGNVVVHEIKAKEDLSIKEGETVIGEIDKEMRLALMRAHTATHILLASLRKVLGPHVWQAGAQKGVERSRLDITHYRHLTLSQIHKIEALANRIVRENRRVKTFFEDRITAEQRYGFTLYQGGVVPGREIRVVEIEDWDAEACGGTHCLSTGEVGLIKIIRSMRIQDGVERIEFAAGSSALKYVQSLEKTLREVSEKLGSPLEDVLPSVTKLIEEYRSLRKENEALKKKLFRLIKDTVVAQAEKVGVLSVIVYEVAEAEAHDLLHLAALITRDNANAVVVLYTRENGKATYLILVGANASTIVDARVLGRKIMELAEGRGGGKQDMFTGRGRYVLLETLRQRVVEEVSKLVEKINK
ncbi:MAG: alanine--tRNA ligase [Thermoprotei archaeon]|nr:MAG: alanine--tRNA ligase [Thermoprotei archaeon]